MALLRLLVTLVALPGRLLIRAIDDAKRSNGVPPLGRFLRGSVHAFLWLTVLALFGMSTQPAPSSTHVAAAEPVKTKQADIERPDPVDWSLTQPVGEQITVTRVVDGDTLELADGRKVRVLGIDSCEMSTPGGKWAKSTAEDTFSNPYNQPVTMTTEPGAPDVDRYGRLLRYVQVNGYDFGTSMVEWDHTGVYQGDNDASDAYIAQLYEHDRVLAQAPAPAGRDCARGDYWGLGDHGGTKDIDVPDNDDGDDGESRFCSRRWWC